jgi:hypothetical protein
MSLSLYICILGFFLCYVLGRQSLVRGLVATLAIGYAYGITKANLPDTASNFIFDAGVLGLYGSQLFRPMTAEMRLKVQSLRTWMEFLIFWALIVFLFPAQELLVRVVGLRTSIFYLPFLLIGARLTGEERYKLGLWLAVLNLVALGFAGAEFFIGVPAFFPRNQMTKIIYLSKDVLGPNSLYRIPSTFANAHSFGGTMVITVPFMAGALLQKVRKQWHSHLLILGLVASVLGVLLSATRLTFVALAVLIMVLTFSIKSRIGYAFGWIVILITIGFFTAGEARLQRVLELQNTEYVKERVTGSVNMTFFELAAQYPLGNGLGGGGTNIPYFLQGRIRNPIGMENEYARIMLEQGIFGLLLWIAFIVWLVTRYKGNVFDPWSQGRRLAWYACIMNFGIGLIGIGMFASIPQTCLLLMSAGWVAAEYPQPHVERAGSPALEESSQLVANPARG